MQVPVQAAELPDSVTEQRMLNVIRDLFPLNRTIVSRDAAEAMRIIRNHYPLDVHSFPTGNDYQTWVIPPEWNVRGATLHEGDALIASYDESPLFVAPYSLPFSGVVSRDELIAHTFSNPQRPDAFCYEFRLAYNFQRRLREWRIALPHERVQALGNGPFHLEIGVDTRPGNMLIGESLHPGRSGSWFTLLAHYCHIGQANDGLAGVAVMLETLARIRSAHADPLHGYRAIIMPETIGSSVYAATHELEMDHTLGAVFSEMAGADAALQLVFSRRGDTYIDRVFLHVLAELHKSNVHYTEFRRGWGNDELVFDSPGVGVPAVSVDRQPFAAYHTHHDDVSGIHAERLEEIVEVLLRVVGTLEGDFIPRPQQRVPVYLSRYDLYADWTHARERYDLNTLLLDSMWSGLSVLDIALYHDLDLTTVRDYIGRFAELGLIDRVAVTPEYTRTMRFLPRRSGPDVAVTRPADGSMRRDGIDPTGVR